MLRMEFHLQVGSVGPGRTCIVTIRGDMSMLTLPRIGETVYFENVHCSSLLSDLGRHKVTGVTHCAVDIDHQGKKIMWRPDLMLESNPVLKCAAPTDRHMSWEECDNAVDSLSKEIAAVIQIFVGMGMRLHDLEESKGADVDKRSSGLVLSSVRQELKRLAVQYQG